MDLKFVNGAHVLRSALFVATKNPSRGVLSAPRSSKRGGQTGVRMKTELPEDLRHQIFAAIVEAQDAGASVPDSRALVAARHGITVEQVKAVERQGLDEEWLPL